MKSSALEVWAPFAGKMEAVVDGECFKMHRDPTREGWWTTDAEFPTGTRYGFSPEGRGPFPDPRSQHQPDGIHAQSCLLDHGAFPWTDHGWQPPAWEQSVVYEIHIGTFSEEGTFDGAIPHLDHLARLGITHVEIMPCAGFPGSRNWGYDCVSINAPNEVYGGPDGLKRLVDACHARGLAVIMDVIYNHMGAEGDHTADLAPYFTDRYHTPWGGGPDLDGELSPEVRAFFLDNALMWLRDYHADGLRLDAIDKVTDGSPRHFLVELRAAVDQLAGETGQRKVLIAESAANDPIFVQPVTTGGYGMDAQWADDVHHSLHGFFSGERQNYYADFGELDDLAKALRQGFVYDGCFSRYRGEPHGKSPAGLAPSTFLVCLTNHDQVGNRPKGERFHHLPGVGRAGQKIASALLLLSPFVPMIFMGEEWAASTPFEFFTDHQDPEMAAAVGKGRKEEFGGEMWDIDDIPDPQDERCFLRSKLKWEERFGEEHRHMLGWYSQLLRLRKENSFHGPATVEAAADGTWLRMAVGKFEVVATLTEDASSRFAVAGPFSVVLSNGVVQAMEGGQLHLSGRGVAVIRKQP